MKKAILFCFILFSIAACSNDDNEVSLSKTELLTGSKSKTWYLYSQTPGSETCPKSSVYMADNALTFFADGKFEYSTGAITEVPDCTDCCGDLIDFTGTWEFAKNESGIKIVGLQEKGNPDNSFNFVFMDGTIDSLTDSIFKLILIDPDTHISSTYEFRVKEQ